MMKIRHVLAALMVIITCTANAAMPPRPAKCPAPETIAAQGVESAYFDDDSHKYSAVVFSDFDTSDDWAFVIGDIKASSSDDAVIKANTALQSLRLRTRKPQANQQYQVWYCLYTTKEGYLSGAITPLDFNISKLRGVLR